MLLELDAIRKKFFPEPTYSMDERDEVYRRFAEEARDMADQGHGVIMDATAPHLVYRHYARTLIKHFAEVYLKVDLQTAIDRETTRPKGTVMADLYRKALERKRTGKQFEGLGAVPGVDDPFEEDENAECVIENVNKTAQEAVDQALEFWDEWSNK